MAAQWSYLELGDGVRGQRVQRHQDGKLLSGAGIS